MGRPSDRRRTKKRNRKAEEVKRLAERARMQRQRKPPFPEISYCSDCPETLVSFVKQQMADIVANRHNLIPKGMLLAFEMAALHGFPYAFYIIEEAKKKLDGTTAMEHKFMEQEFQFVLGHILFSRFPVEFWNRFFPFVDVQIDYACPRPNAITVRMRSMKQTRTEWGTAYWSPRRPTVQTKSGDAIVAFSRHAAERICSRTTLNWRTYGGLGDAFAKLHDCVYYEPWCDDDGNDGFIVFDSAVRGYISWQILESFVAQPSPDHSYYFRCGYCPANRIGDLLVAKTLLTPGMRGTPERAWAARNLSSRAIAELDDAVGVVERTPESINRLLDALRPIHDRSSLKQVQIIDHKVFDYSNL